MIFTNDTCTLARNSPNCPITHAFGGRKTTISNELKTRVNN